MMRRTSVMVATGVTTVAMLLGACSSNSESTSTSTEPSTTMAQQQSIVDVASANPDFSTLVTAIKAADLVDTLSGPGPFTVFAPTNEAFAKLPAGTLDTLLKPENKQQLTNLLTYHVVPGRMMAADVKPGKVRTVNGAELTVSVENGNVFLTDGKGQKVQVTKTDIEASNGVIHVINGVLQPA